MAIRLFQLDFGWWNAVDLVEYNNGYELHIRCAALDVPSSKIGFEIDVVI